MREGELTGYYRTQITIKCEQSTTPKCQIGREGEGREREKERERQRDRERERKRERERERERGKRGWAEKGKKGG